MVEVEKSGYVPLKRVVKTQFQPIGFLNVFTPFAVTGFVIDAITGDMMKISPDSRVLTFNLVKAVPHKL